MDRDNKGKFIKGHKGFVPNRPKDTSCICGKLKYYKRKFCSHECYWKSKIGEKHTWGEKISFSLKGKKKSLEHNIKNSLSKLGRKRPEISGEKNSNWLGSKVGYYGLHDWVLKELGYAIKCEHCGIKGEKKNGRWNVHWANKSHEYKRIIEDWVGLCRKCHYQHDKNASKKNWK